MGKLGTYHNLCCRNCYGVKGATVKNNKRQKFLLMACSKSNQNSDVEEHLLARLGNGFARAFHGLRWDVFNPDRTRGLLMFITLPRAIVRGSDLGREISNECASEVVCHSSLPGSRLDCRLATTGNG